MSTGLDALIKRPDPTFRAEFSVSPCVHLVHKLYTWQYRSSVNLPSPLPVSIVCISDTHNTQPALPHGDILIHAGDLTQSGTADELEIAIRWLASQPHPVKIVIAGKHDLLLHPKQDAIGKRTKATISLSNSSPETVRNSLAWNGIIYLKNESTVISLLYGRRLHVYGSPYSPRHGNWAFQYSRSQDVWYNTVPEDTDILITHGPPRGHLDLLNLGCMHLLRELWRVRPRLHMFGHIHTGAGTETVKFDSLQKVYEKTLIEGGGIWNLICIVWHFLMLLLESRRQLNTSKCTLVNASMVGGLRDDQIRDAVRVVI